MTMSDEGLKERCETYTDTLERYNDIYIYTLVTSGRLCFGICVVLFSSGIIVILILSNISNSITVAYYAASYFLKKTGKLQELQVHMMFFSFKMGNHLKKCPVG